MERLAGKQILFFVGPLYEDLELWYPKLRLAEEGAAVTLAGLGEGRYAGKNGYPCAEDVDVRDIQAKDFDGLVIPGGFAPDKLRRSPAVLSLTAEIFHSGRLVAHICHAGWVPISAGIMGGMTCTSTPAIRDDLVNAGATWVDQEVVVDKNMVSSRNPQDLPRFCQEIIAFLSAK
ncbi:type 1 glutamine amidotransferase domain-containing protein [Desulfohalobium retbaense]|uniref:Intracellular protease, PfpI family n=1 Tax=Desulfohalobium retbaense (strain ATCC 49708 / DSM 5692 / JCM 16813 / HR100) TaxID=485915 RepID=C8X3K0_DESRD|nr:type 1 glutamine amidotransferase domain-containing protein [Desulfohalobium retbaense]ACV68997.1 intracellular protease, PfpI family [Desulfohalobium retbaense DSM 5692]